MTIIIIGNGPGGFYTAQRLRKNGSKAKILMFDKGPHAFYTKIRLPEYIAGKMEQEKLFIASEKEIADLDIDLHLNEEVVDIDTEGGSIQTGKNSYSYDNLVLALGADAFIPPIKGTEQEHVHALRSLDDAEEIIKDLTFARTAAVIGGGLLGLETAHALVTRDLKVSVVEFLPQLLPQQLGEESSEKVRKHLEDMGIDIYLDRVTETITEDCILTDKDTDPIPADVVLLNTGIRSRTDLAEKCGLETDKGIVVNNRLETSAKNIYAVGDCAQGEGGIPGLWMSAKAQGEALADILTGKKEKYSFPEFRPFLKIPGMKPGDY